MILKQKIVTTKIRKLTFAIALLLWLVAYFSLTANAQKKRIKFDHITLEDGLSESTVNCILQDTKGFMWFATLDGLNKYDGYKITEYRNNPSDSSITDNYITTLYEDKNDKGGSLWIGTRGGGLSIYDRINDKFTNIKHNNKNNNSLSSDIVLSIFKDKSGIFWVGTTNGLNKYDKTHNQFTVFKNKPNDKTSLSSNNIKKIIGDKSGNLWIGTDNGLNFYNTKENKFTHYSTISGLSNKIINDLFFDMIGALWIATDNGLNKMDVISETFTVYQNNPKDETSISGNKINCIYEDNTGSLWVGTEKGGLNKFDRINGRFLCYVNNPADPQSLSVNNVISIYQDRANVLWVGTALGGVNKVNKFAEFLNLFRHNPYDPQSLSSSQVRCIYQDRSGQVWIGTVDGGLNKWDRETNRFSSYKSDPSNPTSLSNPHIRTMLEDSKGNFWIGTDGGGINKFDRKSGKFVRYQHDETNSKSLSNDKIWKMFEDRKGNIWVATDGGGLNKFDTKTGTFQCFKHSADNMYSISDDHITTIFEDYTNTIWVGTFGGGLNKWDEANNVFINYKYEKNVSNSLGNNRVYSIHEDKDGILWIGTKGCLNRFDRNSETFERFTESSGLPNDVILGILEDDDGNLWVSSNGGIFKFNKRSKKVRSYDMRDGLQSNEFLAGSAFKTIDGEMLFGGINGFNAFYPSRLRDNPHKPEIVVTGFKIFNKDAVLDTNIAEKKILILSYKHKVISFDFVALDYTFPLKNQYSYMLEGFDNKWINLKTQRTVNFTNLPPDKYVLKIIGSNNDEIWNEVGTNLIVIIEPAWYQTLATKITALLVIIISVYAGFKYRIRRIERQKQHLEELVKIRTHEILAQKEEIEAQRDEIEAQRNSILAQRDHIAQQNQEILDSIVYARRIQTAVLPSDEYIREIVDDFFVLLKPKDIVSGDFYWISKKHDTLVLIAADCTGHGVPGAFMSMFGVSFLNKIVIEKGILHPTAILDSLRSNIIRSLKQKGLENEARDGMDIALCSIDTKTKMLHFAGANNPLFFVRKGELHVVKADKMPIGIYDHMEKFTTHEVQLEDGDCVYIFSDGYADQFGGQFGKKFKFNQFREIITQIADKPMTEQRKILDETIETWMGIHEQVDDILVMGFRF